MMCGAGGRKHWVLMELLTFPGLMAFGVQPGMSLNIGLWKAWVAIKLPAASPATRAVNGVPSCAIRIPPICHPCVNQLTGPACEAGTGTSQMRFATKFRGTLKADAPRLYLTLNGSGSLTQLLNSSASKLEELSSMLLDQVYDTCA